MGRQLPWANPPAISTTQQRTFKTAARKTPKDQEASLSNGPASAHGNRSNDQPSTPRANRKRLTSRSPSTSPPPGPPPVSPIRPGYANDDLYIMVEDEFWSVAQSYTAHLHHAEYKRLMHRAKQATPRKLSDLSPSRPRDARDRARRTVLRERQRSALDEMVGTKHAAMISDDDADNSTRIEGSAKKSTNPWRGTSLDGLMSVNEQTKTSLVGLDRLPSSTRAARGYGKSNAGSSPITDRTRHEDAMDMLSGMSRRNRHKGSHNFDQSSVAVTDARDARKGDREHNNKKLRFDDGDVDTAYLSKGLSAGIRDKPTTTRLKRSFLDALEEGLEDDDFELPPAPTRSVKMMSTSSTISKKETKRDLKSRVDEVPMFLF